MSSEGSTSLRRRGNPAGGKECKPYFSKGTSQKSKSQKSQLPPFLRGSGDVAATTAPISRVETSTEKPKDSQAENDARIINERTLGSPRDDPVSKRARTAKDGSSFPIPKPPATANAVHHLFARYGNLHATEAEASDWCNAELEANADSLTKCLAEAFVRQVSHLKDLKHAITANAKLEKEVAVLKFKLEEDKKSLTEAHKLALRRETAKLRHDLKNAISKNNSLEKSLKEAEKLAREVKEKHEKEIAKLNNELEAVKFDYNTVAEEHLAKGQVDFMKEFIKKIPNFDWDKLGPGNADFAETLRQEIEDEAQKEAEELEARQKAEEEARLANEAEKNNQNTAA